MLAPKDPFFSPFQMGISFMAKKHGEKHPNQPRISCPGMIFQVGRRPKPLTSPAAQGEHPASLPRGGKLEPPPPTCDGKHPPRSEAVGMPRAHRPVPKPLACQGPNNGEERGGGGKHTKPDVFKKTCVLLFLSCSCTSCVCSLFFWTCWIDFISSLLHPWKPDVHKVYRKQKGTSLLWVPWQRILGHSVKPFHRNKDLNPCRKANKNWII